MQYICKIKTKHYMIGEAITPEQYDKLPPDIKPHFEVDYSDESIGDQISRNLESDNDN